MLRNVDELLARETSWLEDVRLYHLFADGAVELEVI